MGLVYVEEYTRHEEETTAQATYSDECIWKTQIMGLPADTDYFDNISLGDNASGVFTESQEGEGIDYISGHTSYDDESLWKTQEIDIPSDTDYFDNISLGDNASNVEADGLEE